MCFRCTICIYCELCFNLLMFCKSFIEFLSPPSVLCAHTFLFAMCMNNSCKTEAFRKLRLTSSIATVHTSRQEKCVKIRQTFFCKQNIAHVSSLNKLYSSSLSIRYVYLRITRIVQKIKTYVMDSININILVIYFNSLMSLCKLYAVGIYLKINYLTRKNKYPKSIKMSLNWRSTII